MRLYIYKLDKTLYEGDADVVSLPAEDGEIAVLPHHAPIVTSLKKGTISVKNDSDKKVFSIESGFAEINQEQTILLVK
ncbi:MAG: hypothetical protein A3H57_04905 [Candidatus Taylorbacteria bacterium RIFCSPLOWO2_02_FULL_43_11]|uniref:ATP synthase F1 complex delta/epsilon subunit N-terminal domain-containing protein n=1 Tax=Candidatus Taylorbacteria bacterium RIFCSPHIGHO2_02_FULL_43_32b TaxID=1802306 RepID=A0A1G2MK96_9BACT|nr:MAG: hypothetical protein A2743_03365 [Candidatus Taylorbacteria bacterium RIFCSPHIGHO2_01_FULL_43_47]OHA24154.1 MAG: hypothetical protein A3C72_03775 [Candidatus Taylorbacteria bacterium RIFCSPHIGHO2_02_FULL_43_32b]OHA31067.1 MAG: hypothetical protein A3B08_01330 [Candidatus Taylorbacteria bacterium RIFCSPLOWO2_01_FULL_43_44]OHA37217.1 MAG: hypothetical protein A3H57_04905 [Candidatus Taylorbacteria bacterium RIFCSPLOWO2_02_FULL_43_11]